jgi:uncharacterized protein YjiK
MTSSDIASRLIRERNAPPGWLRSMRLLGGCLVLAACGCAEAAGTFELGGYHYSTDRLVQWALPKKLREISGLTLDPDGRLFAHDDEIAVIYQIDYENARIVKGFALGSPPLKGDFEGIAWVEGEIYLVTSDGDLLVAAEGADGAHVPYERIVTGLGNRCEIEGLEYDPKPRLLRLACKTIREPGSKNRSLILAWSVDSRNAAPEHDIELRWPDPEEAHASAALIGDGGGNRRRLRLSGIARATGNDNWIAVSARQNALVEFSPAGDVLRAFQIPSAQHHPQMEGITVTASGILIIADDASKERGRLSVYAPGN